MNLYRIRHSECKKIIADAKRNSWENFLDSINASQTSSALWTRVNALSGKRKTKPLTLRIENSHISDPSTVARILGEYFASLASVDSCNDSFKRRMQPTISSVPTFPVPDDPENLLINQPFSISELLFALKCCTGKSAGPDGIGYPLIKNLPPSGKLQLLELMNKYWLTDTFPPEWRESLVVPIPKSNAETHDPSKYRPIALTCCMCKVMERMVNRRLKQFLESQDLLDHRQHAFRAGHGTSTYFAQLGDVLHTAQSEGLHTEIVSLDLSKAFNRTWTPLVLRQLVEWKLSGHILRFVQNFLSERSFRVIVGDYLSDSFPEETGVPQGSVIAVTLFLIAMNSVFLTLPKGIYVFVYADDILIVVSGKTPVRVRIKAQAAVNAIFKWTTATGFELSAPKSVRCHVCPTNHRISVPISINGQRIPTKKTVKVLGVTIDRALTFQHHFDLVKQSCRTRLNLIRTISRPHRSNNRNIRFRVAHAIVDSRLTYGLELTCIARERLITTLAPLYHGYIRIISGLLPSTPADSACTEAGLLPFRFFISAVICKKTAAIIEKTIGDDRICLLTEGNSILRTAANVDFPPVAGGMDICWLSPKPNVDSTIGNQFRAGDNSIALRTTVLDWLRTKYPNHDHRYTDGSLSMRGVGLGVFGPNISVSLSLSPLCSIFQRKPQPCI